MGSNQSRIWSPKKCIEEITAGILESRVCCFWGWWHEKGGPCFHCVQGKRRRKDDRREKSKAKDRIDRIDRDLTRLGRLLSEKYREKELLSSELDADDQNTHELLKECRLKIARICSERFQCKLKKIEIKYNYYRIRQPSLINALKQSIKELKKAVPAKTEWDDGSDENTFRCLLLSSGNPGKSQLANRMCGDYTRDGNLYFPTNERAGPLTSYISHVLTSWTDLKDRKEKKFCIIDTPASAGRSGQFMRKLAGSNYLNAIIIVRNEYDKFRGEDLEMMEQLERQLTPGVWHRLIFVFTRGGRMKEKHFEEHVESVRERLEKWCSVSEKLKKSFENGCTRRSVWDIPMIGLDSFNETGNSFDYRKKIDELMGIVSKMPAWQNDRFLCTYDRLIKECRNLLDELIEKEDRMIQLRGKIQEMVREGNFQDGDPPQWREFERKLESIENGLPSSRGSSLSPKRVESPRFYRFYPRDEGGDSDSTECSMIAHFGGGYNPF